MMQNLVILVVEDNRRAGTMYEDFLDSLGCKVLKSANASEALEYIKEERLDLVILDYRLPDASGIEVLKAIRKKSATLPVVMITGIHDIQILRDAMENGATRFLTKPVLKDKLLEAMELALEESEPPALI